jgi:hypothetical protein
MHEDAQRFLVVAILILVVLSAAGSQSRPEADSL